MTNRGFETIWINILDRITDVFPSFGPKVFQRIFLSVFGSEKVYKYYLRKYRKQLLKIKSFERLLLIADINIGDAVLLQNGIEALRYYFPEAQIDYACNKGGGELIENLPKADTIYKVFSSAGIPSRTDIETLKRIISANKYSLILNMAPFLERNVVGKEVNMIQLYLPFSVYLFRLLRIKSQQMHFSDIICSFLTEFLRPVYDHIGEDILPFHHDRQGNVVYVSNEALQLAREFLISNNIFSGDRILLFNPDATSKYSMIPFDFQVRILKNILPSAEMDYLLISSAYNNKGIEHRIVSALPEEFHRKVIIVPHVPLSTYTALIDLCDVFLSGDTGPVHIAASRKELSGTGQPMRNRTVIVSVIGATDSQIFSYDSSKPWHTAANQNAPSKSFVCDSPCRNITCLNKTAKTCKDVNCFANIETDKISSYIVSHFSASTPVA